MVNGDAPETALVPPALEQELERSMPVEPALGVDTSIPVDEELAIYEDMRKRYTYDYHRLIIGSRLNRKVENKELADKQESEAKKILIQIAELDKDIAQLRRGLTRFPNT